MGIAWHALRPPWTLGTLWTSCPGRTGLPSRALDTLVTFRALQALQTTWACSTCWPSRPSITFDLSPGIACRVGAVGLRVVSVLADVELASAVSRVETTLAIS